MSAGNWISVSCKKLTSLRTQHAAGRKNIGDLSKTLQNIAGPDEKLLSIIRESQNIPVNSKSVLFVEITI